MDIDKCLEQVFGLRFLRGRHSSKVQIVLVFVAKVAVPLLYLLMMGLYCHFYDTLEQALTIRLKEQLVILASEIIM